MPHHGLSRWHHGGPGLHHGQDQGEARARQTLPGRRRHQDAPGQG